MRPAQKSRPARIAGRIFAAVLLLAGLRCSVASENPDALIQRADAIKTADNPAFLNLLQQLDAQADRLSPLQRDWLAYLKGWQSGLQGDYPAAVAALTAVLDRTQDPTVHARARISLLNDQSNAAHYEEAYANLSVLLDSLPQIEDRNAHFLSLTVAAIQFNQAGQYDLATNYIDQAIAYDSSDRSTCFTLTDKTETLYKTGKLRTDDAQIRAGLDACQRIGDPLYANLIRLWLAQAQIEQGDASGALQLLKVHDAEVQATNSSELNSRFRALLAKCYLLTGDLAHTSEYARSAIEYANKQTYSKSVADAYEVLYEAAKQQGDDKNALAYHEKYAAADKGYLNDTSARTLAFQMVNQQVLDKKRQIDALSEKNRTLQLTQQVAAKSSENRLLYIALLVSILAIVTTWAYRTKRSQLKFQKLARRDGLTGIFNRQHFFESAQAALRYGAKDAREASVLAMDLDHFKSINDMHGHAAGDAVLKRVVAACQTHLRSVDLFGRLGGEEFAILMPDCAEAVAAKRADEMRAAIAGMPGNGDAADVVVTASFGIATTRVCGYNLPTLLANADDALYSAKHAGRNRVAVFPGIPARDSGSTSAAAEA